MQQNRQQELLAKQEQGAKRYNLLEEEISATQAEKSALTSEFKERQNQQQDKIEAATKNLKSAKTDLAEKREAQQQQQKTYFQKETELSVLSQQLKSKSISENLKAICEKATKQTLYSLYEQVTVPDRFVRAFNAVVGNKVEYLIAERPYSLVGDIAELVKDTEQNFGLIKANSSAHSASAQEINAPSGTEALIDCVQWQPQVAEVLKNLLANVFYTESADVAYHYIQAHSDTNYLFVTADGQLISKDYVGFNTQSGILGLQNQVNALTADVKTLSGAKESAERNFLAAQSGYDAAEETYQNAIEENRQHETAMRELKGRIGSLEGSINAAKRNLENLQSEKAQTANTLQTLDDQQKQYSEMLAKIDQGSVIDVDFKAELEKQIGEFREKSQVVEDSRKHQHLDRLKTSGELETLRNLLEQQRQKITKISIRAERIKSDLENTNEKISEEYSEDFRAEHLADLSEKDIKNPQEYQLLTTELKSLRGRLLREGEVDPDSITAYEAENQRLTELKEQNSDLSAALESLEQTLKRLLHASEQKFIATFNQVAENFADLVPKMYGGGYGKIELDNPEQPLDAGLLITIRPPGKKLKSIELMSGGEKALAATALIVAMFLVRPSPLCILDEVDAPLDDANLNRFLAVVQEMSGETQFLMVTHNKHSMSVCDQLVGITMQQPGATQMLQVSLQEAKQHAVA